MAAVSPLSPFNTGLPAARVDAALRAALVTCDQAQANALLWFAEVQRRDLHRELGYASLQIYAKEALRFSDNRYWQFKRLADALERLPDLRRAVSRGELGWTKAQLVARVATAHTQERWVARAKAAGRRDLEREVRAAAVAAGRRRHAVRTAGRLAGVLDVAKLGAMPAGLPTRDETTTTADEARPAPVPPMSLLVPPLPRSAPASAEPAVARDPAAGLPMSAGGGELPGIVSLRLDTLQLARFEALLERARRLGRVASTCDRAEIVLAGLEALVAVGARSVEPDSADAGVAGAGAAISTADSGAVATGQGAGAAAGTPRNPSRAPATPVPVFQIVVQRCPDCGAVAAVTHRGERRLAPAQVARVMCDNRMREPGRANRSTIQPRVRAAVLARDRHRCSTPGCGAIWFLEVHHVLPRRLGGSNRLENLVTLCGRCHRFAHEKEGAPSTAGTGRRGGGG